MESRPLTTVIVTGMILYGLYLYRLYGGFKRPAGGAQTPVQPFPSLSGLRGQGGAPPVLPPVPGTPNGPAPALYSDPAALVGQTTGVIYAA